MRCGGSQTTGRLLVGPGDARVAPFAGRDLQLDAVGQGAIGHHLGQVLRTEEDFVIIDFEGEPARSIAERRARQSPLKDVAGMVRSYSYAAFAALFSFTTHAPPVTAALDSWADHWRVWVSEAFIKGYRDTVGDAPFVPRGDAWNMLLCAFALDKAIYELEYELNNRPDWLPIPLLGINTLIGEPTLPHVLETIHGETHPSRRR
jgi:maltose alpha-D-glucosyltransferase/alpha-amylase